MVLHHVGEVPGLSPFAKLDVISLSVSLRDTGVGYVGYGLGKGGNLLLHVLKFLFYAGQLSTQLVEIRDQ